MFFFFFFPILGHSVSTVLPVNSSNLLARPTKKRKKFQFSPRTSRHRKPHYYCSLYTRNTVRDTKCISEPFPVAKSYCNISVTQSGSLKTSRYNIEYTLRLVKTVKKGFAYTREKERERERNVYCT